MRGLNKVTLIGHLGKDPEILQLDGNITIAKFSLATTETFKDDKGQTQSSTEWHSIVVWRSLADLVHQFLKKGSLIYLEGKLKSRSYDDASGNKKYMTEIIGESFIMLDKRPDHQIDN